MDISACMMVKDEEVMLPGCLETLEWVDEIVVVDTGSTDKTMEIAKHFGAKVYEHPWEENFSLHRNQSLEYATGKWLLVIDADERMVAAPILPLSTPPEVSSLTATIRDRLLLGPVNSQFQSKRLFQNGTVHYEGTVHNKPVTTGKTMTTDIIIDHYGYDLTPEQQQAKFDRTRRLLVQRLEADENDYEALFYMAELLSFHQMPDQANQFGELCLQHLMQLDREARPDYFYTLFAMLGANAVQMGEFDRAEDYLLEGTWYVPHDIDNAYWTFKLGKETNRKQLMRMGGERYLALYPLYHRSKFLQGSRFIFTLRPDIHEIITTTLEEL